ncbi:MAG: hypothetical protein ARM1_0003 [Candidatus Micrarchaeota archaeon]|nr:MAG: hypothetical protein ARM1_0003 [Candidatus Micrarchaeota archaeon]
MKLFALTTLFLGLDIIYNSGLLAQTLLFSIIILIFNLTIVKASRIKFILILILMLISAITLNIAEFIGIIIDAFYPSHITYEILHSFSETSTYDIVHYGSYITQTISNLFYNPFNNINALIYIFIIFSIILVNLAIKFRNKYKDIIVLQLITLLILFFALSETIYGPFGNIFKYLYNHFILFSDFRFPINNENFIYAAASILLSLAVFKIVYMLYRSKVKMYLAYIFIIYLLFFLVYFIPFYKDVMKPIIKNKVYGYYNITLPVLDKLPNHVLEIADYINKNISYSYNVMTLPSNPVWQIDTWYAGVDIYPSVINASVFNGGFTIGSEYLFPPSIEEYQDVAKSIEQEKSINFDPARMLGILGIKYIIIQGDTAKSSNIPFHPLIPYNMSYIYNNLNNSKYIQFKAKFSNSSIYENYLVTPLVYASNIKILNSSDISLHQIVNYIEYNNFSIFNYSVYAPKVNGSILYYGYMNIYNATNDTFNVSYIKNMSKPNVSFQIVNPSKVIVYIKNATTPFYLVFRETYDPAWTAYYQNGTEVNQRYHIMVNGFANAFYINKTGSYEIILYYKWQRYITAAFIAEYLVFGALVSLIIYSYIKERKGSIKYKRVRSNG